MPPLMKKKGVIMAKAMILSFLWRSRFSLKFFERTRPVTKAGRIAWLDPNLAT